jgi:hypothetical protein
MRLLSADVIEIRTQRLRDHCGEGEARLDRMVLDVLDQGDGKINVELANAPVGDRLASSLPLARERHLLLTSAICSSGAVGALDQQPLICFPKRG